MKFALGQAVPRTEDPRLLTGRGRYTDDFVLPRLAHAYTLRSPHAHARIRSLDTRAAQQTPGVLAVLTGEDWAAEKFGVPGPVIPRQRRDGSPMFVPSRPALAQDRAMLVGEPVAFVVAESVDLARDAAERIAVEYEPLPSVTATEEALLPDAPQLWAEAAGNECFFFTLGDKRAVEAGFARADHVSRLKLIFNRVTASTMESRGCIGEWDDRLGRFTLYVGTQRPHTARADLTRRILHIPETQLRVVAGEVGGSFGMKGGHYPEYALVLWASRKTGRPVKWIAEHAMALMLALSRRLPDARDNQQKCAWRGGMIGDLSQPEDELAGKTLLVVGLGDIGGRLAQLAKAFDMHVVGLRRHPAFGRGAAHAVHAMDEFNSLLPDADFVALTCPLTAETENLVDAEAFGRMKPTAHLVNVARGRVVDEAALVEALMTRRTAGAGIDVTAEEPLAPSSPLWAIEQALITPHTAGETRRYEDNVIEILLDNLGRLWRGEAQLRNQIV